ncbi:MAG: ATP-dependent DNA helicase DinG [Treponema sp.]|jgi:ATP-dependent DNA helicase DinG|nr:ATP-dependent DNA helicase DinG [Treponema sp.]
MKAIKRFSPSCIARLQREIQEAQGNEVFALGFLDTKGLVSTLEVSARGQEQRVLAVDPRLEAADVFIHNHPSGLLTPSDADLAIASRAAQAGVGCFIVDNPVEQVYVVTEPIKKRPVKKLHAPDILAALEEGGAIAKRLPAYENRRSQLELMQLIIRGFNDDALVAAEAGTGVGKSFAYLLPALSYALANDERIVISTATITLQQQLYEKDIPLVISALGNREKKLKVVLIKGRGHYLCRRRLKEALQEQGLLDEGECQDLRAIHDWSKTTRTGSRSDLSFMPQEGLWSRICAEADCCMGMHCPEREGCFVLALRKESADARILVVNHHLLFADLAARHEGAGYKHTVVLPPYSRVIVDEAHTVEGAATSFFSQEFSRLGISRHLGRLYRRSRGGSPLGLLPGLASLGAAEERLEALEAALRLIRDSAEALDLAALELCQTEGVFRLTPSKAPLIQELLLPHLRALGQHLCAFTAGIQELLDRLEPQDEDTALAWEVRALMRRLDAIGAICTAFMEFRERSATEVLWLEGHFKTGSGAARGSWAAFIVSPIAVAPSLKEALFVPNKTVICLSATLTVADSFAYWNSRCGLSLVEDRKVLTGQFPSPFPYASSVLLAIPQDAPLPEPDHERYRAFVDKAAVELVQCAGGSSLVLFTSYEALRSAYTAAVPVLAQQGIRCLKQGDDDRNRLLRTFLKDEQSVLFATDSFWEGVDAPGDTLRLVILCRLPFRAPNEPVFQARCEALQKQGANPFMELSLPESVMKFKQGFGRLMRRSSDHGVVVVLDGRVLWKRYGQYFLRSLPETKTSFADFTGILRQVERFLGRQRL